MGLLNAFDVPGEYLTSELREFANEQLKNETKAAFLQPQSQCATSNLLQFAFQDIGDYIVDGISAIMEPIPQAAIQTTGIMGLHGLPQIPLFFYKSEGDEISPVSDNDELVAKYCAAGVSSLQYYRDAAPGHIVEAILGTGDALGFIKSRFAGEEAPSGCQTHDILITELNEDSLSGFGAEIIGLLKTLLLAPKGPGGSIIL